MNIGRHFVIARANPRSYTGEHGFYASVSPTQDSVNYFRDWWETMYRQTNHDAPMNESQDIGLHCTVMYSHAALQVDPAVAYQKRSPDQLFAQASEFVYWDGHDNDGYFVLQLDSPALHERHELWRLLGAKPAFDDYIPHMTLATGNVAKFYWRAQLNALNKVLKARPFSLVFENETINDLK